MRYLTYILYIAIFILMSQYSVEGMQVAFIGGIIRGIGAGKMARDLERKARGIDAVRPEYDIPQEVQDYLTGATNMAQGDMPGYGRAINQAYGATANTLGQARNFADSGTGLLQSLSMAGESQRRNIGDINTQNLGFRANQFNSMQQALMDMAGYQDQAFEYNENQPYLQAEADKRAYQQAALGQRQAATEGWASTADSIVNLAATAATGGMGGAAGGGGMFANLFGGGGGQATNPYPVASIPSPSRPPMTSSPFNLSNVDIYR